MSDVASAICSHLSFAEGELLENLSFAIAGKIKLISKYFPFSVVRVIKKVIAIHAYMGMDVVPRTTSKDLHRPV